MQAKVAHPHLPYVAQVAPSHPGIISRPAQPDRAGPPKSGMVPRYISEKLTMPPLQWSQECLRQGCTLLATYKCTLPPFLAPLRGLRPTEAKWSQTVNPLVQHGPV